MQPNLSDRVFAHHSGNVSIDEPMHNLPFAQTLERPASQLSKANNCHDLKNKEFEDNSNENPRDGQLLPVGQPFQRIKIEFPSNGFSSLEIKKSDIKIDENEKIFGEAVYQTELVHQENVESSSETEENFQANSSNIQ